MSTTIFEILFGAVIAILITIVVENLRKPRLSILIAPPVNKEYENRPGKQVRFISVRVVNRPLPRWARWMSRDAATQCHGIITFHHLDGQNIFGRAMSARWSSTPEPLLTQFVIDEKIYGILDPMRALAIDRVDIYPSEMESLDVAARLDEDTDCYGWNNESFFSEPIWRNPIWRLPAGRYLVRIIVTSACDKASAIFRLINDVPRTDFRLEPPMSRDVIYD